MRSSRIISTSHSLSLSVGKVAAICVLWAAATIIVSAQTFKTLHRFDGTDGADSTAGMVQATDGNFYGTTYYGGANNNFPCLIGCGTVFKITPTGTLTTLYSFCSQSGCTDGDVPVAGLLQSTDGSF